MNNDIYFLEVTLALAAQLRGYFLLETKLLQEWSEKLNKFVQNVNKQFDNSLTKLMDKFIDGQNLRTRKTPPVVVTENDHVVVRKVYTEYLTKKNRLNSM